MNFLSLITCTKDRPLELHKLLTSIRDQEYIKPNLHIIVDGSDYPESVKSVVDQFKELPISYFHLRPPGLTRQKNFGISHLPKETDWVGVLDDDVILDKQCLQNIKKHINSDSEVRGIGLVFSNIKPRGLNLFRNLLLLDGRNDGGFTPSGLPTTVHSYCKERKVEWLHGGATFWHKKILDEYRFDEWFSGVGHFEDIDFSYRVSRKNKLIFLPSAQSMVLENPIPKQKLVKVGTWQVVAWWYFATKKATFNKLPIFYSMLGLFIVNFAIGIFKPTSRRLFNAWGNLKGFMIILSGKVMAHKGYQK